MTKKEKKETVAMVISPPRMRIVEFLITGTTPYVQNKFSQKALSLMKEKMLDPRGKNKNKKEPKNFKEDYENSRYVSDEGWFGIPAPAFRNAMISACRVAGFVMTKAKLAVFIEADGFDAETQKPLVKITKGEPEYKEDYVVLQGRTPDIHARAMWRAGWEATLRIRFDEEQFSVKDVANLLMRVGAQVGIGEGRPDSKTSCGMGWGLFKVCNGENKNV